MSSKNAYEIRLEILKEAQGNCWQRYHQNVEAQRLSAWTKCEDDNLDKIGDFVSGVPMPKTKDIIEEANELYKFVNGE
jgi:hypothetical protein